MTRQALTEVVQRSIKDANFRSQLKRKLHALERLPGVRFRRTVDAAELEADLRSFVELHEKRWQSLGRGSTLADPLARQALARFARGAFAAGWLRLWFLEVEERPAAVWFGWRLGDRYSYYQAGLDPARSSLSAGFLLLAHSVRAAIEEGAAIYDLLAGEEAFKRRFATGERLAKRDRALSLHGLRSQNVDPARIVDELWRLSGQEASSGATLQGRAVPTAQRGRLVVGAVD